MIQLELEAKFYLGVPTRNLTAWKLGKYKLADLMIDFEISDIKKRFRVPLSKKMGTDITWS